jgi:hypothetical protein
VSYLEDPYPVYRRLRAEHPVSLTPDGVWRLTRYDDYLRMLRSTDAGMRRTDGTLPGESKEEAEARGQFMLLTDPPKHTRLRKLVSKAFTPRAIAAWRPRIEVVTDELLDRVASSGEMELISAFALPVPATLICEMLGVPVEDRDEFTEWTADATHGLALRRGQSPPEIVERVERARLGLAGYFNQLIAERRVRKEGDDLLGALIAAEEEGDRLNPEELLIQSIGLLVAGFETTIGLIGNGLTTLIRNPEEIERLRTQPELIESAVEECLRYSGPITWSIRVLHKPAEFGGFRLDANEEVAIGLAAANRDPEHFDDPERFDVARYAPGSGTPPHLSFGGGAHVCLGAHLARLESQIAIGRLISRFTDLELLDAKTAWGRSLFRVPSKIPVRFRALS